MKTIYKLFYFLLFPILISSCLSTGHPEDFDYGSVSDNIYTNDYFRLTVNLPDNWDVQSQEQMEKMANIGKELVAGDDQKMKAVLKASEINNANLLAAFQYEIGTAVDYNPNFMIVAENIRLSPGIKTGSDYLYHSRKIMKQSQAQFDYISESFESELIGGIEFYKMDAILNFMGLEIKQRYYSTVLREFSLNVIISFMNEDQERVLLESINSMKFEK